MSVTKQDNGRVLPLPFSRPALGGATRRQILAGRLRTAAGRWLNRLGVPGAIKDTHYIDAVTGQHLRVSVGPLFVCVSVDGRDYYFSRFSGRLDGTGMGYGVVVRPLSQNTRHT